MARAVGLVVTLLFSAGSVRPLVAADRPQLAAELDPFNHAYAVYLGSGYYVVSGRSVFVLRIAPRIGLRSAEEHPFGIRLRLNGTVGFYNFEPGDLKAPTSINTFAFVPGAEFPIGLRRNWTLAPFLDFGVASDTALQETTLILGTGARSRATFLLGRYELVMWNELIYAANHSSDLADADDYSVFRTDLDLRDLLSFRIADRPYDIGVLVTGDRFLNRLVVFQEEEPLEVANRWHVGLTVGPRERWRVFRNLLVVPRLGIGYSFGDGASGIRVLLRTRY